MQPLLELSAIVKSYGGVHALRDVSFDLRPGEIHALVGENGAGKSTLINIITGAVEADGGTLGVRGRVVTRNSPARARRLGIAAIYQQPALFPDLTVAENIAMRMEHGGPWRIVRWRHRRQAAVELLRQVGADISPDALAGGLSMPEQQLVEIAAALGAGTEALILDEPTASLGDREVHNLFDLLRRLRGRGVGMIYVSHRLEELSSLADRITVLRDGQVVAQRPAAEMDRAQLIPLMVGRSLEAVYPKANGPIGGVILEARGIGCAATGIHDVNLTLRMGEIVGVAGLVGAGRTELARVLFGLTPADRGRIFLQNHPVDLRSPTDAIEHGIAYVPEDRRRHGVIPDMSVSANVTLAVLDKISRSGLIDRRREHHIAGQFVRRLETKIPSLDSPVAHLSGGNQQKVALARWLVTEPVVLILDEPTQGVDVGAKAEIHRIMVELAGRGLAILMISSDLPEIMGMSDRVAVMRGGTIAGIISRSVATQERILQMALGPSGNPAGQDGGAAA